MIPLALDSLKYKITSEKIRKSSASSNRKSFDTFCGKVGQPEFAPTVEPLSRTSKVRVRITTGGWEIGRFGQVKPQSQNHSGVIPGMVEICWNKVREDSTSKISFLFLLDPPICWHKDTNLPFRRQLSHSQCSVLFAAVNYHPTLPYKWLYSWSSFIA